MNVRRASLGDAGPIAGLMAELGYPVTEEGMSRRLRFVLDRADHGTFVALCDGSVVGMVGAFTNRRYDADAPYGQLLALVVSHEHRRRGVGRALVEVAERWLAGHGVDCVIVHTGLDREDAHEFYVRLGYQATASRFMRMIGSASN